MSQRYFSSSRDSLQGGYVNRGASELDLSRKPRRRDHLRGRFKLPYTVALTSSRDQSHLHTPASVNHLSNSSCNGTETWVFHWRVIADRFQLSSDIKSHYFESYSFHTLILRKTDIPRKIQFDANFSSVGEIRDESSRNEYNEEICVVKYHKYSSDFLEAYHGGVSYISKDRLIVPGASLNRNIFATEFSEAKLRENLFINIGNLFLKFVAKPPGAYKIAGFFPVLWTFNTFTIVIFQIDTRILVHGTNSNGKNGQPCRRARPGTKVINQRTLHWITISGGTQRNNNNSNAVVEAIPGNLDRGVFARVRQIGPSSSILRDVSVTIGRWWFLLPFFTTSG